MTSMFYQRNQTWSAHLNLLVNHLFSSLDNNNVIDKLLPNRDLSKHFN